MFDPLTGSAQRGRQVVEHVQRVGPAFMTAQKETLDVEAGGDPFQDGRLSRSGVPADDEQRRRPGALVGFGRALGLLGLGVLGRRLGAFPAPLARKDHLREGKKALDLGLEDDRGRRGGLLGLIGGSLRDGDVASFAWRHRVLFFFSSSALTRVSESNPDGGRSNRIS